MSDSAESSRQLGATDTVRQEIEDVEDVNEATKRVNSILNELRGGDGTADVQIVIADLADDDEVLP